MENHFEGRSKRICTEQDSSWIQETEGLQGIQRPKTAQSTFLFVFEGGSWRVDKTYGEI